MFGHEHMDSHNTSEHGGERVLKGWWYLWVKGKGVCGKHVVGNLKELCP